MSDTSSSITHHHSSSSSSNHKELIKSDSDEHANTSRIFDWLMKNHHSNVNDDEDDHSEKQISNSKLIENKKKEIFQTKIIPLTSDALLIQSDIRLKIYTSLYKQTINSICLPLPKFAQYLSKNSIIINPKAHLKHLLIKQQTIQHEDFVIDKELNERIKLLDKQLDQINQNQNIQTSTITCHPIILTPSSEKPDISSMKFKRKTIPPPLSAIPALPISSNTTDSPLFPTPKSATSTSAIGNQNNFRTLTFSPASQKPISNNSPKPTVLKSILKQPSNQSQSISNETRKAVHIISTNSSVESSLKQKLPSNNTKKTIIQQQTETKKTLKTIETPPPVATNVFQSTAKPVHPPNKITKPIKLNNKSSLLKPLQQNKTNTILKKKFKSSETTCMYDRIKKRARIITKASMKKETDKSIIFDSEIFDTDEKKINQQQKKIVPKFNKKDFILKRKSKKRRSIDQENKSSKKIKSELKLNEEQIIKSEIISTENVISTKDDVINSTIKMPINDDDDDDQLVNIKVETIQLGNNFLFTFK